MAYCYEAPPEDPTRFQVPTESTKWIFDTFLKDTSIEIIQRTELVGRGDTIQSHRLRPDKFVELHQKIKEQYGDEQQITAWIRKDAETDMGFSSRGLIPS